MNVQLAPNIVVKQLLDKGHYRWVLTRDSRQKVAFKKEEPYRYDVRFSETNYVLSIDSVQRPDEGRYKVECWYTGSDNVPVYLYSNSVDLKLQEPIVTIQTPTTLKTKGKQ